MTITDTCIYTARYLVSGNAPPVEAGAFFAHAGKIAAIGTLTELKTSYPHVKVVDFDDALMVPLLVNAHTHLELTDFPQWTSECGGAESPENFVDWILHLISVKRKLKIEQFAPSLQHGIEQSIAAGTGAVGDILAYHPARSGYGDSSLLGNLYLETLGQDPAMVSKLKAGLAEALEDKGCGAVKLGVSPHSPYTLSANYLRDTYLYCRQHNLRCTTHLAEAVEEVEFVEKGSGDFARRFYPYIGWEGYITTGSGLRPVEYLRQQGGLFPQNLLVHGVQLNDAEIDTLAAEKMSLVLCPRSNATLKVGKAPAKKLLDAGVRLALGTDSLASCDSLSIWDEMAFAHKWFAGDLDAPTLFGLATSNGAKVLGVDGAVGSLALGKDASFQVLQPQTAVAVNEVFDYFVSSACSSTVKHVYHRGVLQ